MQLLKQLQKYKDSPRNAVISDTFSLTYRELWEKSEILASVIKNGGVRPVIVYGHKSPYMLVGFLACAKAGVPYVPIDINMPENRIIIYYFCHLYSSFGRFGITLYNLSIF